MVKLISAMLAATVKIEHVLYYILYVTLTAFLSFLFSIAKGWYMGQRGTYHFNYPFNIPFQNQQRKDVNLIHRLIYMCDNVQLIHTMIITRGCA